LLERDDHVVALKVALELPHHHQQHGLTYRVRIEMIVPGGDLVISQRDGEEGHTDLDAAIDDAFRAAERRLREHTRVRRGDVKSHASGRRAERSS
jgi:ribosome-associated translation inhibitor RaiA